MQLLLRDEVKEVKEVKDVKEVKEKKAGGIAGLFLSKPTRAMNREASFCPWHELR